VKNFLQFSLAVISYFLIGYAFSFGDTSSHFIGQLHFGSDLWLERGYEGHGFCFSYNVLVGIFVIYIINVALVEKVSYIAYVVYPVCLLVWVWPVVIAWTWGDGWLVSIMKAGIEDFGGSISVFTFAGAFGLIGAVISGRREGRFSHPKHFRIVHTEFYLIGCFLTILGVLGIGYAQQTQHGSIAIANLWICGAISSIVALKALTFNDTQLNSHYIAIYQGFIAGMVLYASSAGNSRPWLSGIHGVLAGLVFALGVKIVQWFQIDDAGNVTATFLFPGICGGLLPGFVDDNAGVYFAGWDQGQLLGTNTTGTAVILLWSVFWAAVVFGILAIFGVLKLKHDTLEGATIGQTGFNKVQNDQA
jgi:ammonium transporter, Amt family